MISVHNDDTERRDMTTATLQATKPVSDQLCARIIETLTSTDQPLAADEVKRSISLRHGHTYHITSLYTALLSLVETGKVTSRQETADERALRFGYSRVGNRHARLFYAGSHVPQRTVQTVTVFGKKLPAQVIVKPRRARKSRPAYTKKVQTGRPAFESRPAIDPDVQTGLLYQVDKLSARVEELELTLEMMRRLLRLAEKF